MTRIVQIVVHWSATAPEWLAAAGLDAQVAEIRAWHRGRGWIDVGYHWLVGRCGRVAAGRPESMRGAHVLGMNAGRVGVCLIGGPVGSDDPVVIFTDAQLRAARLLIEERLTVHPGAEVVGHRDLAPTLCPGFDVRAWWAAGGAAPRARRW